MNKNPSLVHPHWPLKKSSREAAADDGKKSRTAPVWRGWFAAFVAFSFFLCHLAGRR